MQLRLIATAPGITIYYDESNQWLYADWQGVHTQESSRDACLLLLEALRLQPCAKILNDNSNVTSTTVELSTWGEWWLEEMLRAGLRYLAWIYPRLFAARDATESILIHIKQPRVASFDDVASAYVWLQQQLVQPLPEQIA